MKRALFAALVYAIAVAATSANAGEGVKVGFAWKYRDFTPRVRIFQVKGRPRLWETRSVKSIADAPVTQEAATSGFTLKPGWKMRFALVVRNGSDKPLYFFASPHEVDPIEHSIGFDLKCLCINHAFKVGAGETWYRIVDLRLDPDFVGNRLTVTHTIIGIDAKRAEKLLIQASPSH